MMMMTMMMIIIIIIMLNSICIDYNLTYKIPCLIGAKIKLYCRYKIMANKAASTSLIL